MKPGPGAAIKVVHHAVVSIVPTDGSPTGGTLVEYAVGKNGDIYPDGAARLIKAGARINFNMHYHSVGEEIRDRTRLGIVFHPEGYVPKHVMRTIIITNSDDLDIPAGDANLRTDAYYKIEQHSRIVGFIPHMHNRGKWQCVEAIYPNMAVEPLNCVNFDFQWQIVYNYADDVAPLLPAGTILHVTSWHDNSAANRNNPDPLNRVGFGQRTTDDMARHWLTFYPMSDDEFRARYRNGSRCRSRRREDCSRDRRPCGRAGAAARDRDRAGGAGDRLTAQRADPLPLGPDDRAGLRGLGTQRTAYDHFRPYGKWTGSKRSAAF